jgi:hypothetical protein
LLAWGWLSLLWLAGAGCDLLSLLVGLLLGFFGEVLLIVSAAVVLLLMESMSSAGLEGDSFSDTAGFWVSLQMLPLSAIFFFMYVYCHIALMLVQGSLFPLILG